MYDDIYILVEVAMSIDPQWENKVKGLLKAELKRRNVAYQDLVEKLALLGISETPENIANKISRGKFTAVFLIQCLEAIGCQTIRLSE